MNYLKDYKNPCWHSKFPKFSMDPYPHNPYHIKDNFNICRNKLRHGGPYWTRCLPLAYLIGVTKSGTTDLYENIMKHWEVARPSVKEPMWWNRFTIGKLHSSVIMWRHVIYIPGFHSTGANFSHYVDLFDTAAIEIEEKVDLETRMHKSITREPLSSSFY